MVEVCSINFYKNGRLFHKLVWSHWWEQKHPNPSFPHLHTSTATTDEFVKKTAQNKAQPIF
jgi:hypothetical protein